MSSTSTYYSVQNADVLLPMDDDNGNTSSAFIVKQRRYFDLEKVNDVTVSTNVIDPITNNSVMVKIDDFKVDFTKTSFMEFARMYRHHNEGFKVDDEPLRNFILLCRVYDNITDLYWDTPLLTFIHLP